MSELKTTVRIADDTNEESNEDHLEEEEDSHEEEDHLEEDDDDDDEEEEPVDVFENFSKLLEAHLILCKTMRDLINNC